MGEFATIGDVGGVHIIDKHIMGHEYLYFSIAIVFIVGLIKNQGIARAMEIVMLSLLCYAE